MRVDNDTGKMPWVRLYVPSFRDGCKKMGILSQPQSFDEAFRDEVERLGLAPHELTWHFNKDVSRPRRAPEEAGRVPFIVFLEIST